LRQSHGQYKAWETGPCADISDAPSRAQLRDLKATECIRNVHLDRCFRVSDRGMRVRLCGEDLEDALDLSARGPSEAVSSY